jgi:hypothetical protein
LHAVGRELGGPLVALHPPRQPRTDPGSPRAMERRGSGNCPLNRDGRAGGSRRPNAGDSRQKETTVMYSKLIFCGSRVGDAGVAGVGYVVGERSNGTREQLAVRVVSFEDDDPDYGASGVLFRVLDGQPVSSWRDSSPFTFGFYGLPSYGDPLDFLCPREWVGAEASTVPLVMAAAETLLSRAGNCRVDPGPGYWDIKERRKQSMRLYSVGTHTFEMQIRTTDHVTFEERHSTSAYSSDLTPWAPWSPPPCCPGSSPWPTWARNNEVSRLPALIPPESQTS